jgi:capsular polysaccharide biosynthesis protein
MEIKHLLRVLLKKWWIILSTVFITVGSAIVLTLNLTPLYSATVSYIVSPSADLLNGPSFVSGLSVLGAQSTITNTYATIATSASVRENAVRILGLNEQQNSTLEVRSRVQSGTNLIEITVEGNDPLTVQAFANRLGQSTEEYVATLYEVYDMKILDRAKAPEEPIWPDMRLNLVLAFALGLVLGSGIAFVSSLNEF